jgi:hypothetical protein
MKFYNLYTGPEIKVIKPRIRNVEHVTRITGKVKVQFTLEQATNAQTGNRCVALLFLRPRR